MRVVGDRDMMENLLELDLSPQLKISRKCDYEFTVYCITAVYHAR